MTASSGSVDQQLQALLREYGGKLKILVRTHCNARQGLDADDIEQEVLIKLWKLLESDKNIAFPASYLQKVVLTTVIDGLRRAQVRPTEELPESDRDENLAMATHLGPERNTRGDEVLIIIERCIAELPPRRQQPVRLLLQGFKPVEIAQMLDTTIDTIRTLSHRGMEELRQRLRDLGMGDYDD